PSVIHVRADDDARFNPQADGADHMHLPHWSASSDNNHAVILPDLAGGRNVPVGLGGIIADGADPPGHAVMDPPDADVDRSADSLSSQDDIDDAAGRQLVV